MPPLEQSIAEAESVDAPASPPERHHADYVPRLSLRERDRRWGLARERMAEQGFDCLVIIGNDLFYDMGTANARYLTHIGDKLGVLAVFPIESEPVVWVGLPHYHVPESRYRFTQDWVTDIRVLHGPGPVIDYLIEHGFDRAKIGVVGVSSTMMADTSALLHRVLVDRLPEATIESATGLVNHLRATLSDEEITMLGKAGSIARSMIETLVASAEPGKKECEVFADMVQTHIAAGGEAYHFILLASGPVGEESSNKSLRHGFYTPLAPTHRKLELGDQIIVEFHANYGGYLAAAEFSVFLGEAPPELRRIHEVSVECAHAAQATMRPGVTYREVWEAERAVCREAGLDFLELGFHMHGLTSGGVFSACYKPGWGPIDGRKIGGLQMRENMAFGTNIDLYDPAWKPDVGLMLGDTLLVTSAGARPLVDTPLDFFEKEV